MKRCLDCGALTRRSRCDACAREHELRRSARRGTSGYDRQRRMRAILARDLHLCRRCGERATEVDHVVPLSQGGTDAPANLQALCRPCHASKGRGGQKVPLAAPSGTGEKRLRATAKLGAGGGLPPEGRP
ncbi:MAG: HNH endonuclease [SAR202 cluster bacterium]|nr:HNH endonuclease [SAR202 cluster bacterium]